MEEGVGFEPTGDVIHASAGFQDQSHNPLEPTFQKSEPLCSHISGVW